MTEVKIGIYSAIYGRYDEPKPMILDIPARMMTDWGSVGKGWDTHCIDPPIKTRTGTQMNPTNMLRHKFWKTHPHAVFPDADFSIWIDGSIEIADPNFVDYAMDALGDDDWAMVRHPHRDCIYDEATFSAQLSRYDAEALERQATFYKDVVGHPAHWGLPATGVNIRRHTPAVLAMCEQWWDENLTWSHQDQISLPVLMRLNEGKVRCNYNLGWGEGWYLHEHSSEGYQ